MSKAGQRLIRGAEQALEYALGRAKPGSYRVHVPEKGRFSPDSEATEVKFKSDGSKETEQVHSNPEEVSKATA